MKIGILIKQDIKNLIKNPVVLLFCTVYPFSLVLIFGFLFSNIYGGDYITSYDFYGITMIFYLILSASTITPITFMEEKIKNANIRIAYSPVTKKEIYLSKIISTYLFTGICFIINILVLQALNLVNYGDKNFLYILILFLALLLFSINLGALVCVIIKNQDLTNKIVGSIVNIIALLSGIFFPVGLLGKWVENIAQISPITWVLNKIFEIIYDGNLKNYYVVLSIIFIIILGFIFIIDKKYNPEDYI